MSGKVSGQVWDLDMRALVEQARAEGKLAEDLKVEPQPLRTVLLALADHADHNGRNVYPGVELLVWKTELSERRVRALLSLLRTLGILVAVRYAGGGRGHATEYRLDFRNAPRKPVPTEKHDADDTLSGNPDAGDSVSAFSVERVQRETESLQSGAERVQFCAERVQPEALKPAATGTPTGLTVRETSGETSGTVIARGRARELALTKDESELRSSGDVALPGFTIDAVVSREMGPPPEQPCPLGNHRFIGSYADHIAAAHQVAHSPPRRNPPPTPPDVELAASIPA